MTRAKPTTAQAIAKTLAATPARGERARLLTQERRMAAKAESDAVRGGVAETVSLAQERGAEFLAPKADRGGRDKPVRRLSGLEWLRTKDRVTEDQKAAGERYGAAYRRAMGVGAIRSILNDAASSHCATLTSLLANAEATKHAADKLAMYRRQVSNIPAMVTALDVICGEELTPREAGRNGTEASAIEASLLIALSLLATNSAQKAA